MSRLAPGAHSRLHLAEFLRPLVATVALPELYAIRGWTLTRERRPVATRLAVLRCVRHDDERRSLLDLGAEPGIELSGERATRAARVGTAQRPRERRRPGPLVRRLLQIPAVLYDCHLGWLLGRRFLRLTHVARRTGRTYRMMLEVIGENPSRERADRHRRSGPHRPVVAQPPHARMLV